MRTVALLAMLASLASAEKVSSEQLVRMAQLHAPDLEQAIRDTFADPKPDPKTDKLLNGSAYAGEHGQFLFAIATDKQPFLQVNEMRPEPATRVGKLWVYVGPAALTTWRRSPRKPIRNPACRKAS